MILRDEKDFQIECDIDDERAKAVADGLVNVFSQYCLEGSEVDPVGVDVEGIKFIVRYKKIDQ